MKYKNNSYSKLRFLCSNLKPISTYHFLEYNVLSFYYLLKTGIFSNVDNFSLTEEEAETLRNQGIKKINLIKKSLNQLKKTYINLIYFPESYKDMLKVESFNTTKYQNKIIGILDLSSIFLEFNEILLERESKYSKIISKYNLNSLKASLLRGIKKKDLNIFLDVFKKTLDILYLKIKKKDFNLTLNHRFSLESALFPMYIKIDLIKNSNRAEEYFSLLKKPYQYKINSEKNIRVKEIYKETINFIYKG